MIPSVQCVRLTIKRKKSSNFGYHPTIPTIPKPSNRNDRSENWFGYQVKKLYLGKTSSTTLTGCCRRRSCSSFSCCSCTRIFFPLSGREEKPLPERKDVNRSIFSCISLSDTENSGSETASAAPPSEVSGDCGGDRRAPLSIGLMHALGSEVTAELRRKQKAHKKFVVLCFNCQDNYFRDIIAGKQM